MAGKGIKKMNVNEVFPSTYLKASDLESGPKNVTIGNCKTEEVGQGDDARRMPVLEFRDGAGALVVNKTNWNTLLSLFGGTDTDEWNGRTIQIYSAEVSFAGKMVKGIRLRESKPLPSGNPSTMNLDEEVPF